MRDAEIIYALVALSKLSADAKMIGGVMSPASMASACCNPLVIASASGRSASSAKNGGCLGFL
jgi:hypothetical protein